MRYLYERPDTEIVIIVQEDCFLQSGGNGSSESVSYDEDPFAGGGN